MAPPIKPVRVSDPLSLSMLLQFADAWAKGKPTAINVRLGNKAPSNVLELTNLCTRHNIIDLYLWLSNRFPGNFVERELALVQKDHAISLIQQGLKKLDLNAEEIESMGRFPPRRSNATATATAAAAAKVKAKAASAVGGKSGGAKKSKIKAMRRGAKGGNTGSTATSTTTRRPKRPAASSKTKTAPKAKGQKAAAVTTPPSKAAVTAGAPLKKQQKEKQKQQQKKKAVAAHSEQQQ
jgi:hypothetical protein